MVRSLEQIEETYAESAIKNKEEIKTFMVTQLKEVLSGIHNIGEEMTDELYDDLLENIEAISDIAEAHCIDEILSEDLKETSELLSQSNQQTIKATQAVRPTQDNPLSQEPPTDNEQQYNQDMINAAIRFANRHKRDRDESKKILLPRLMDCNDEKTLLEIKNILERRMGVWAKIKARMGYSRTGKILKTVDSKVRQLNDETYKQKVQKTQDGIKESKKIKENRGTPFGL
ncbi:MAG: hypothetical protein VXZ73_02270 [Pseudomonadota bacterium]|nr:hypothetical protein [Pseudomonadota bacterium]MEC8977586.1 hypothetical protein [Pseudomonadota bacterium]